jgi:hypothetical protein
MQILAGVAILTLVVCSAVVGVRMLSLWRRTRQLPELLLGLAILLLSVFGYPLMIGSRAVDTLGFSVAWSLFGLSMLCAYASFTLLYAFTWRTFRPQATWCAWPIGGAALGLAVHACLASLELHAAGTTIFDLNAVSLWRQVITILSGMVAYGWTAWEALRYHGRMRRQLALGMGDPVVCNRFLLWGIMSSIAFVAIALNNAASIMAIDPLETPWLIYVATVAGMAQAIFLALTFLPPRVYLAWVRRRHAAVEA